MLWPYPGHVVFERSKPGDNAPRRANVYDVARAAGVSHQSVSNVLNKPERVSPAIQAKVLAAIEELSYEASATAKALDSGRTNILGLQIPRLRSGESGGFFEHFTLALADAARAQNQQVLVFTTDDQGVGEHSRLYRAGLIDGIVIADTSIHDSRMEQLSQLHIPFVAFGRTADSEEYAWVDVDNLRGIHLCVERLSSLGHKRIAYLDSARDTYYGIERAEGFQEAMLATGQPWEPDLIVQTDHDRDAVENALLSLVDDAEPPTAVIAGSDLLAARAIDFARKHGLSVGPHDFALITFDDTVLAAALNPPITAIHQPIKEIAAGAVELLHARVVGVPLPNRLLEPTLVIRASG